MLLYHFTTRECLRGIVANGLDRGIVHISPVRQINAVWLTADPGPNGHGLDAGGPFMTDEQRREGFEWAGATPPPGARFAKEAHVRISVELADDDRDLHEWLPWARRHLAFEWMAHLHPVAGGTLRKAKTWRLYFGVIPPGAITAIEPLDGRGLESILCPPRSAQRSPQQPPAVDGSRPL